MTVMLLASLAWADVIRRRPIECSCTSAGGAASAVFLLGVLPLVARRRWSGVQ